MTANSNDNNTPRGLWDAKEAIPWSVFVTCENVQVISGNPPTEYKTEVVNGATRSLGGALRTFFIPRNPQPRPADVIEKGVFASIASDTGHHVSRYPSSARYLNGSALDRGVRPSATDFTSLGASVGYRYTFPYAVSKNADVAAPVCRIPSALDGPPASSSLADPRYISLGSNSGLEDGRLPHGAYLLSYEGGCTKRAETNDWAVNHFLNPNQMVTRREPGAFWRITAGSEFAFVRGSKPENGIWDNNPNWALLPGSYGAPRATCGSKTAGLGCAFPTYAACDKWTRDTIASTGYWFTFQNPARLLTSIEYGSDSASFSDGTYRYDWDVPGGDFPGSPIPIPNGTPEQCDAMCKAKPGCKGWTMGRPPSVCTTDSSWSQWLNGRQQQTLAWYELFNLNTIVNQRRNFLNNNAWCWLKHSPGAWTTGSYEKCLVSAVYPNTGLTIANITSARVAASPTTARDPTYNIWSASPQVCNFVGAPMLAPPNPRSVTPRFLRRKRP
jgi:hypothetical protein